MLACQYGNAIIKSNRKELKVSHSYLSQVINGKRPASEKVLTTLLTTGLVKYDFLRVKCYNPTSNNAEWCSGSTEDFGSFNPGSNPGSAAIIGNGVTLV